MSATTKTIVMDGWVVYDLYRAQHAHIWPQPIVFRDHEPEPSSGIVIQPHQIVVEIPSDFDPRVGIVAGLEERKRKLQAEFSAAVTEINRQISQLTAIEHVGSAS